AFIRHFMCHDQMMLGVHCGLHVVADDPRASTARRHGAAVGIGQRNLLLGRGLHLSLDRLELRHLRLQLLKLSLRWVFFSSTVSDGSCRSAVSSCDRYRATLCSNCVRRFSTFARVKSLSRLLTALNLLPSIATLAFANKPMRRHKATNCAHTRL